MAYSFSLPDYGIAINSTTLKYSYLASSYSYFKANLDAAAAAAKSQQSCPTLCDPVDGSPPGSPIPGILQARTLEWVAISFSNAWKWKVKVKSLSRVWLSNPMDCSPWTVVLEWGNLDARFL